MKRSTFARLALLVGVLTVLLALQGCGGGDDGVDQSLYDQAQIDLDAAEQALLDSEAAAEQALLDSEAAAEQALLDSEAAAAQALLDSEAAAAQALLDAEAAAKTAADAAAAQALLDSAAAAATAADAVLMGIRTEASDAATAAMTASDNAATAAQAAKDARATVATQQTGATSGTLAYAAHDAATMAMAAYMDAKAASDDAAAATDIAAATIAKIKAETAQAMAETQATAAMTKRDAVLEAVKSELFIDVKTKTVGDTPITIDGQSHSQTIDGETVKFGLDEGLAPVTSVMEISGMGVAAANPDTGTAATTLKPTVSGLDDLEIGFVYDSSDDLARLMLITSYAGSRKVNVFAWNAEGGDAVTGTKAGYITIPAGNEEMNNTRLRSHGTFYEANDQALTFVMGDVVASDAKGVQVYSYITAADNVNDPDVTNYVALEGRNTPSGGDTTYTYRPAMFLFDHDEVAGTDSVMVSVDLPQKTDYEHIHFGVWAELGDADDDGLQDLDGLGIGFVQNYSGEGMTEVMPNHSGATYKGNWAATVQAADSDGDGDITLQHGDASMEANFGMGKVTAMLTGLATLEGDIDGATFSGTEATVMDGNPHGLDSDGKFEGTVNGAFYGDKAAEAGGVFDFASEDMEDGAFRGAFGGGK